MSKLGDSLRAQREKKGITLDQAAADTRIREKFLKALEDGDYQSLPGAVYTKGFLRNYAEYLDLQADELVVLFHQERGGQPEAPRSFQPMRPVVHRSLIFTPKVLLPVVVLAGVVLFVGYLYYQFTSFATPPRLDVTDPPGDVIASQPDLLIRGVTVADGRITVRAFPGQNAITDVRPATDGTFSTNVSLVQGANHIEIEVLDAAGKVSRVTRNVRLEVAATTPPGPPPQLIVEQPANGAAFTNTPVQVSGRVDRSITSLQVNNIAVSVNPDGSFTARYYLPAGPQSFRIVARNAAGGVVEETRNVVVSYTAAVVNVFVRGGDAWLLATVDGADVAGTGRVYKDGETAVFTGREVRLRSGNAGATQVIYNGTLIANLGRQGEVVDRTFTAQ
ncbi:MAG: helix-turn-helix domain-containing protein [Chloroflexi bacterium]|nr:MAG: helix-turn-helix domain-containing protein [Chloroflexota bacterium]